MLPERAPVVEDVARNTGMILVERSDDRGDVGASNVLLSQAGEETPELLREAHTRHGNQGSSICARL